jgi:succinate-semialdehyde dehydrogenase/glutarate-semialdehyde dehydrogenase
MKRKTISSIDPSTGKEWRKFELPTAEEVKACIDRAHKAYLHNRSVPLQERIKKVLNIADILEKRKQECAELMAKEMGKPVKFGVLEVNEVIGIMKHKASVAEFALEPKTLHPCNKKAYSILQPTGIHFCVHPWNFPFWTVMNTFTASLLSGMSVIEKPSHGIPQCAYLVEEIVKQAGFDQNEYQVCMVESSMIELVISDKRVTGVSITGSTSAGKNVGMLAGKYVKPVLLELGGSDAFVVLEDADLKKAITQAAIGRLANSGQVCVAAKRMIVHEKVYDKFVAGLVEEVKRWKVGNPLNPDTFMGPLARMDLFEIVRKQVKESVEAGAKVAYGDLEQLKGPRAADKGNFFHPMVLTDIPKGAPARDGIFIDGLNANR